ncbi:nitroreductase family protein [Methanobrevibacter sp.]|uniref:nitroreductase family protein n=1 Tax=Methanobrevibacter sp. TaxID=66852 RepID=UPI002E7A1DDB|nr:nitroreductase family protein [Methanobrevibacter sp.]MEE0938248.1 nitroreductase family protein [Methanobrevibacter sp.]
MSLIFKRHSVRRFRDEKVSDEKIENLLKAGMQAPSACNAQPWEFIVVSKAEDKQAISEMHQFAKPAANASHLIITLGNLNESKVHGMIEQDLGACNENILLQATHEGLGAVWLGFHPIEDRVLKLKEYLDIPDYCIPFSVICVGYPAQDGEVKLRYDESKVHFDRY